MSSRWKELVQEYRNSCTVPEHPKKCPDCSSKVSVYQMNFDDAIFMCSNEDVSIKVYMYIWNHESQKYWYQINYYLFLSKYFEVHLAPGDPQTRGSVRKKWFIHFGSNQVRKEEDGWRNWVIWCLKFVFVWISMVK